MGEILLAGGFLVQISKQIVTDDNHTQSEKIEAMRITQNRPIALKPATKDGALRSHEEHTRQSGDDVRCAVEEEELIHACQLRSESREYKVEKIIPVKR